MRTVGFDKPLYILPFDHRGSFQTKMFGWKGTLTAEQTAEIAATKQVIYDGFQTAVSQRRAQSKRPASWWTSSSAPPSSATQRHTATRRPAPLRRAARRSSISSTARSSPNTSRLFQPTFCKVLVRYNPEGDQALNARQAARLNRLSDYLHSKSQSRFMFELLVPAEKAQLDRLRGDKKAYDLRTSSETHGGGHRAAAGRAGRAGRLEDRRARSP